MPDLRPRTWVLLAVAAAATLLALLLTGGEEEGGLAPDPRRVRPAAELTDSVGVAMHLSFLDSAYADQPQVFARLRQLGVRHIREGALVSNPEQAQGLRRAAAQGLRGTLVAELTDPPEESVAAGLRAMGEAVEAFEAPNELDAVRPPDWERRLDSYLPHLRAAVARQRPRVPLVGPSFADVAYHEGIDPDAYDILSLHPYPGGLPPESTLSRLHARARDLAPGKPVAFTETGYHNALAATVGQPPTSEEAAGIYLPRAILTAFDLGVRRTFVYELVDHKPDSRLVDPERHFGLLRNDLSPKPAFDALRNLLGAVRRSPGAAGGAAPAASVESDVRVERVDLRRSDGSRLVALWRRAAVWDRDARRAIVPRPAGVIVTWPTAARDLSVLRPSRGAEPVEWHASTESLELRFEGDVVLLSYR